MTLLSQNQVILFLKSVDAETNKLKLMLVYTEFLPGAALCQIKLGKDTLSAKKGKRKITLIRKQVSNGRRIRHFGADA